MKISYQSNQERTLEYLKKKFNRETVLKNLVTKNDPIIFDVGANIGETVLEFKNLWRKAKIYCFEPQAECWKSLEEINDKFEDDIVFEKHAVGNEHEKALTFFSHNISSGQSGFNKINKNSNDSIFLNNLNNDYEISNYEKNINHERTIVTVRLDKYLDQKNLNKIDLLKIDTQGFESEIIEGLGDKISNVKVIITELMFYDYYEKSLSFYDIEKFLIPAGFKLYDISHISKNPMNGRTDWVDVIYLNLN